MKDRIMTMFKRSMAKYLIATIMGLALSLPHHVSYAQETLDRTAIEKIVREYLIENPQILLEVQQSLETMQQQELASNQKRVLQESADQIYNSPYQIEIGDPEAKVTIVEFFDYNCGFCQRALTDMQLMVSTNDNVKFVLKEFPVLGEASLEASRVSMAFSRLMPEKHAQFHIDLLAMEGSKDGYRSMQLALEMGVSEQSMLEEMEDPAIIETIQGTYEVANNLGITGTPSYIVGEEVIFGAVGHDQLEIHIQNLPE